MPEYTELVWRACQIFSPLCTSGHPNFTPPIITVRQDLVTALLSGTSTIMFIGKFVHRGTVRYCTLRYLWCEKTISLSILSIFLLKILLVHINFSCIVLHACQKVAHSTGQIHTPILLFCCRCCCL